ncbi:MAG: AAA family ATPase [Magnetococcus sp. MYC-9]
MLKDNSFARIGTELREGGQVVVRNLVRQDRHWSMTDHLGGEVTSCVNLLAYGPSRLDISSEETKEADENGPVHSLLHQKGSLRNIELWLKMRRLAAGGDDRGHRDEQSGLRALRVKEILLELMPGVTNMELVGSEFAYTERGFEVRANSLSSGQYSLLAMVGDLLIRLYEAQPDVTDPKELQGIVLIDELDVHLHPRRQRELPGQLSSIFPKVQFVATTHSPIPILGAPPGSVFLRVVRDAESGTRLERLEIEIGNLLPNSVLYSPLFGMDTLRARQNIRLADVRTEDSYDEILRNKAVDEALQRFAQAGGMFPEEFLEPEE